MRSTFPNACWNDAVLIHDANALIATGSACTSEKITTPMTVGEYLCCSGIKTHDNRVQPMIQRPMRYVHDREIPKVLEEDLMTLHSQEYFPATVRPELTPAESANRRAYAKCLLGRPRQAAAAGAAAGAGGCFCSKRNTPPIRSRMSRRSTIMSRVPCSSRNSLRWKPSGNVSRTVC
jgi:hypothetical protein